MNKYLNETRLLDYKNPTVQILVSDKKWNALNANDKILNIYNYVRDSITFGYNKADDISASRILKDGYGQCNTKGILFMALLRSVGIPCRVHGFTIDKKLQKGAINGLSYQLSPTELLHSWVEIYYEEKWYNLEGFILDVPYLTKIQKKFSKCSGSFCGYGVATKDLSNPPIYWNQNDTYIQKEGIVRDFGVYDSPDKLFAEHKQSLGVLTNIFYQYLARHLMNNKICKIRSLK